MIKSIIKKLIPKNWLLFYHKILALIASFLYQHPSEKMVVIGVTGTAGKTTTVYSIGKILEEAGYKVGWTNSISFKIGDREIENKAKMTMPGRFFMQKILKEMVKASCQYAILETSSEGILQSRHLGINYDIAVFTNLSPEHIEAHGGFETYKKTKAKLFQKLNLKNKKSKTQIKNKKIIVANLDDKHSDYFLSFPADEKYGYKIKNQNVKIKMTDQKSKIIEAEEVSGLGFKINDLEFKLALPGKFNVYNALAAISVVKSLGIPLEIAKKALEKIKDIPGRMEEVISRPFKVIVDYAHTPVELENVYRALQDLKFKIHPVIRQGAPSSDGAKSKLICVLGSAGGGRDRWKRPELGKLAAQYCNQIILTDEDPYDENPSQVLSEIKSGISNNPACAEASAGRQFPISNLYEILDRKEAIKKALTLAKENDIVIITGKGCEPWMCIAEGKKIPWDDRKIVRDFVQNLDPPASREQILATKLPPISSNI